MINKCPKCRTLRLHTIGCRGRVHVTDGVKKEYFHACDDCKLVISTYIEIPNSLPDRLITPSSYVGFRNIKEYELL